MLKQLKIAAVLFGLLAILTGLIYPATLTLAAQLIFSRQANGSLITRDGQVVGSELVGQQFDQPQYFWGRPSALRIPYDASTSGGSNLGPTNPDLQKAISARIAALKAAEPGNSLPVPVDLVTASGSGLDPDISLAAARYQASRVAKARGISLDTVQALIDQHTQSRDLGVLGEPRVNVLELNLALDQVK